VVEIARDAGVGHVAGCASMSEVEGLKLGSTHSETAASLLFLIGFTCMFVHTD
jgi:hypothetical protein